MNPTVIKDESELPKGAVRVHLYNSKNVLMPRGSMKKESIGPYLLEHLSNGFEDWTDEKYGDNPSVPELIQYLHTNLMGEVNNAWNAFVENLTSDLTPRDELIMKLCIMCSTKPEKDSEDVKWFHDTITANPKLWAITICFLDTLDRRSEEFKYFTELHLSFRETSEEYLKICDQMYDQNSDLYKMIQEEQYGE